MVSIPSALFCSHVLKSTTAPMNPAYCSVPMPPSVRAWANSRLRYNAQVNQTNEALRQLIHGEISAQSDD